MHHPRPSQFPRRIVRSALLLLLGCAGARPVQPTRSDDTWDAAERTAPDAPASPVQAPPEQSRPDPCARAGAAPQGSSEDFWKLVQAARAEVGDLREADFGDRSPRAAALLRALARALVASPRASPDDTTSICEITEQADALVADEGAPFQGSAQIKRGLTATIELLKQQTARDGQEHLDPWLQAARRAVESIDEHGMVSFQGAAIQDAFRAAVDALTLFAQPAAFAP